jgi:hypothetical protein
MKISLTRFLVILGSVVFNVACYPDVVDNQTARKLLDARPLPNVFGEFQVTYLEKDAGIQELRDSGVIVCTNQGAFACVPGPNGSDLKLGAEGVLTYLVGHRVFKSIGVLKPIVYTSDGKDWPGDYSFADVYLEFQPSQFYRKYKTILEHIAIASPRNHGLNPDEIESTSAQAYFFKNTNGWEVSSIEKNSHSLLP